MNLHAKRITNARTNVETCANVARERSCACAMHRITVNRHRRLGGCAARGWGGLNLPWPLGQKGKNRSSHASLELIVGPHSRYNPPMALKRYEFSDIALGWNTVADEFELRPGESNDLLNVLPKRQGQAFGKRYGMKNINNQMVAATPIQSIYEWPMRDMLIVSQDNDIFSTSRTPNSSWTLRYDNSNSSSSGLRWSFELAKDVGGTERLWAIWSTSPIKWDGATALFAVWTINPAAARNCSWIKLWKNRMILGGDPLNPERLYYSPVGDPDGTYNSIDLRSSYDDSDTIVAAELIGDNLLVFKKNSTWLIYDINTIANRRLGHPGVPTGDLTAILNGVVYFMSHEGLWITDGVGAPVPVDMKVDVPVTPNDVATHGAFLLADPIEQRLLYVRPTSVVVGGVVSISGLDLWAYYPPHSMNNPRREGTWWGLNFTPNIYTLALADIPLVTQIPEPMVIGGAFSGGDLFQLFGETETADDTANAVSSHWYSGVVRVTESLESLERIRRCNLRILSSSAGHAGDVTVTLATPGEPTWSTTVDAIDSSGFIKLRPELRGREFRIGFANALTSSPPFEVRDIEFQFRGGKEHK
jgi:hypothetical protein